MGIFWGTNLVPVSHTTSQSLKKGQRPQKSPIMQFDTTDTVSHATLKWPISGMIFKSYPPKQKKNHFALQRLLNENRLFQNLHFFFALRQIFGFRIMPNGCSGSSCLKMPDEKWSSWLSQETTAANAELMDSNPFEARNLSFALICNSPFLACMFCYHTSDHVMVPKRIVSFKYLFTYVYPSEFACMPSVCC